MNQISTSTDISQTALVESFGDIPKLVMFDLDGTLVDSVPGLAAAVDGMLIDLGCKPAGVDLVRRWVGGGQWLLVQQALEFAGLPEADYLDAGVKGFRKHYAQCSDQGLTLFPGVKAFLEFLHQNRIAMAVVTNKPIDFVPKILESLGIDHYFPETLGGECLPEKKPSALPLEHMMARFSVTAEQSLMVGDSSNDLLAAQAAKVKSLAVTYGYSRGVDISQFPSIWLGDDLSQLCA